MKQGFEDAFMDAQVNTIGLCKELLENGDKEADKIFVYLYQDETQIFVNAFFKKSGHIIKLNDWFSDDAINDFFDEVTESDNTSVIRGFFDINKIATAYKNLISEEMICGYMLPFADDPAGMPLIISFSENDYGTVSYLNTDIWLGKRSGCYYNYARSVYWWYVCPNKIRFSFFAFLLFYIDVWIYSLWKKYVKDIAFLDLLYSQAAHCYFSEPSDEMLDFLYNRFCSETLNQKRLLMNENLKIYVVNGRSFNEKYGVSGYDLPMSDEECLLCILSAELNPEVMSCKEVALRDYEIGGCLFPEYAKSCSELM